MSLCHIFCIYLYTYKIYVQGHHEEVAHIVPVFLIFCGKTPGVAKENNHFTVSPIWAHGALSFCFVVSTI